MYKFTRNKLFIFRKNGSQTLVLKSGFYSVSSEFYKNGYYSIHLEIYLQI